MKKRKTPRRKRPAPYGECSCGRPLVLITPWWECPGRHSCFTCACPIPEGATRRDMIVYTERGYTTWKNDPNKVPKEQLDRQNPEHLRKYA